jgi:iron complex transport system permease protein
VSSKKTSSLYGTHFVVALFVLCLAILWSLGQGALHHHIDALLKAGTLWHQVLWQLRVPRVVVLIVVGINLGLSGAVIQGLLRNPLASPSLLGVSTGASFAIVLMLVCVPGAWMAAHSLWLWPLAAFVGALAVVVFLVLVAQGLRIQRIATFLLLGVACNAMLGALLGVLLLTLSHNVLRSALFWTLGSVVSLPWSMIGLGVVLSVLANIVLWMQRRKLNVLALGEADAQLAGVSLMSVRVWSIVGIALSVGVAVALAGPVAFVGLMVPHVVRLVVGSDHSKVLPFSALYGAILMLLADTVCRTVMAPSVLPLSVMTSLLGAPFFVWLLYRMNRSRHHA